MAGFEKPLLHLTSLRSSECRDQGVQTIQRRGPAVQSRADCIEADVGSSEGSSDWSMVARGAYIHRLLWTEIHLGSASNSCNRIPTQSIYLFLSTPDLICSNVPNELDCTFSRHICTYIIYPLITHININAYVIYIHMPAPSPGSLVLVQRSPWVSWLVGNADAADASALRAYEHYVPVQMDLWLSFAAERTKRHHLNNLNLCGQCYLRHI